MKHIKKIITGVATLLIIACDNAPKQATLEGKIENLPKEVTEVVLRTKDKVKNITIENGYFKDTISITGEFAYLQVGSKGKTLFLNKNSHLIVYIDADNFDHSIRFKGDGKETNTYIQNREEITFKVFEQLDSINQLKPSDFKNYTTKIANDVDHLLSKSKNIDPIVLDAEKESLPIFIENLKKQYNTVNNVTYKTGSNAPTFSYENYKGGKTSLEDLKGNLVYIDIWATWCPPCKAEIPYLQQLEKKYYGKKIKFVSISVDSPNTKSKWKKMIADKNMSGVQLFADGDNSLMNAYQIKGIPRFILLDTNGKIINSNAPRPSSRNALESLIDQNL